MFEDVGAEEEEAGGRLRPRLSTGREEDIFSLCVKGGNIINEVLSGLPQQIH